MIKIEGGIRLPRSGLVHLIPYLRSWKRCDNIYLAPHPGFLGHRIRCCTDPSRATFPMGATNNPSTDLQTYPTTAEPGSFAPRLLSGRYHPIQIIKKSNDQIINRFGNATQKPAHRRSRCAYASPYRNHGSGSPSLPTNL